MAGTTEVPNTGTRHNIFPKYEVSLGPWTAGMVTNKDADLIPGNALSDLINFMIMDDGKLKLRPPVRKIDPDGALDYHNWIGALGSMPYQNKMNPVIVVGFPGPPAGYSIYYWDGDSWNFVFTHTYDDPGDNPQLPVQIFGYNQKDFLMLSTVGFATFGTDIHTIYGPANLSGFLPADRSYLRKSLIHKDRIICITDNDLYWSTVNPVGDTSNDWHDGVISGVNYTAGNLGLAREVGDTLFDIVVYQDDVFIATANKVLRLSWSTNPGLDGSLATVSTDIGGYKLEVYNGELYLLNQNGLYRLVNTYFEEASEPVRNFIRQQSQVDLRDTNEFVGPADSFGRVPVLPTAISMFRLNNLLFLGPFNTGAPERTSDSIDNYTGNQYLVLNLDTAVWSKWLFSPNTADDYPIAGPQQPPMPFSASFGIIGDQILWVGLSTDGTNRRQSVYTIDANLLARGTDDDGTSGVDFGDADSTIAKWIGGKFTTSMVDLGDGNSWKRVQTSLIDANKYDKVDLADALNNLPKYGYILNDQPSVDTFTTENVSVVSTGRISFGAAYRCKSFALAYDGITDIKVDSSMPVDADLHNIKRTSTYVTLSRKEPAATSLS